MFFFSIEGSNVVFFFRLNSPTTSLALIVSVNCFFFFVKQLISQAIQARLKRNAKVTTIDFFELLSLVRKREKKLLPIATVDQFFFFSRRFGACSNITREVDDYGKEKKVVW